MQRHQVLCIFCDHDVRPELLHVALHGVHVRKYRVIELPWRLVFKAKLNSSRIANDARDSHRGVNPIAVRRGQGCDIHAAAALKCLPLELNIDAEKAVICKKLNQRECRKLADLFEGGRPDG